MAHRYVMALDQGTTSSRAILFERSGAIAAIDRQEFPQYFPKPGWVEHDPSEIWNSQLQVARGVLERAGATASDVAAIGITNQRETAVVWDRASGDPIHNAIVWQSRQTAGICDALRRRGLDDEVRRRTGLLIDAYFSGSKVRFILDAVEGAQRRAERGELAFGTVDSWLLYKLTGGRVHATEVSNASRTLIYNIHERDWDDLLLGELNIPRAMLPEVRDSSGIFGVTDQELLGDEIRVAGIAGDQQAALFGQGCTSPGRAKNTYGTGCFLLMNTGADAPMSTQGLITTMAWSLDGKPEYALEGSIFVAGAAVQWLRDGIGLIAHAADSEAAAQSVDDTGGVYLVPAFVGLGAPYWDERARGDRRNHTWNQPRTDRAGNTGIHRLPDPRRRRLPAGGFRTRARSASRRWRCSGKRLPDAIPSRHPRCSGGASKGLGSHGTRCGAAGRACGRVLVGPK